MYNSVINIKTHKLITRKLTSEIQNEQINCKIFLIKLFTGEHVLLFIMNDNCLLLLMRTIIIFMKKREIKGHIN